MMSPAPSRWTLSVGFLEESTFVPIDRWERSITERVLVVARLLVGELPEPGEFQFRVRDAAGKVVWKANARSHRFRDRGEVFVGDLALMADSIGEENIDNIQLRFERGNETVAVLPFGALHPDGVSEPCG